MASSLSRSLRSRPTKSGTQKIAMMRTSQIQGVSHSQRTHEGVKFGSRPGGGNVILRGEDTAGKPVAFPAVLIRIGVCSSRQSVGGRYVSTDRPDRTGF